MKEGEYADLDHLFEKKYDLLQRAIQMGFDKNTPIFCGIFIAFSTLGLLAHFRWFFKLPKGQRNALRLLMWVMIMGTLNITAISTMILGSLGKNFLFITFIMCS